MKLITPIYQKSARTKNRILNGKPVLVLMYHRVDSHAEPQLAKLTVSAESFDRQLEYFSKNYTFLTLESDWKAISKTGIVLTFDDGYAQTIETVLPILEKYNAPATFFIPTENIGADKEFWWDKLANAYNCCDEAFFLPSENVKVLKSEYSYNRISEILVNFKNDARYDWIGKFLKINNLEIPDRLNYKPLNRSALTELAKHPLVKIALHTHTHPFLGKMDIDSQKAELESSVSELKTRVGDYSNFLAVPYGSYNADTVKVAKMLGINGILLANDNYSNDNNKQSGKINRILMPDIQGEKLKKYIRQFD
ncbi:MAG: hypothetical protein EOO48_08570 [Flavobacterium sp.]|nr:MAG: hypothetical protein EOO48_08570 [Flavobacterium sp.]